MKWHVNDSYIWGTCTGLGWHGVISHTLGASVRGQQRPCDSLGQVWVARCGAGDRGQHSPLRIPAPPAPLRGRRRWTPSRCRPSGAAPPRASRAARAAIFNGAAAFTGGTRRGRTCPGSASPARPLSWSWPRPSSGPRLWYLILTPSPIPHPDPGPDLQPDPDPHPAPNRGSVGEPAAVPLKPRRERGPAGDRGSWVKTFCGPIFINF